MHLVPWDIRRKTIHLIFLLSLKYKLQRLFLSSLFHKAALAGLELSTQTNQAGLELRVRALRYMPPHQANDEDTVQSPYSTLPRKSTHVMSIIN